MPKTSPRTQLDLAKLSEAIALAVQAETRWPRDLSLAMNAAPDAREPEWNEVLGPTVDRGGPSGLVLHAGELVGRWGAPARADMTFSVTKSFLGLLAGIALADGLIESLDVPVRDHGLDDGFESPQNRSITWRHLLEQTSEWEGTLWDKPDLVDRHREVGVGADNSRKGTHRDLQAPGTYWEYNDVRVNRLSLSLLQLFGRPLPDVLRERIMVPIGASDSWAWNPYRNSSVSVQGKTLWSVPGGGHWGGGLVISSEDLARVGRLVQLGGRWGDTQILEPSWCERIRQPCALKSTYGLMWWVNPGHGLYPAAPEPSYFAVGAGSNIVWIDDDLELVVVMRWIKGGKVNDVIGAIREAFG